MTADRPFTPEARHEQIDDALRIAEGLRSQGWGKVEIAITRGGTYRVVAEEGALPAKPRHEFTTGRR